LESRIKRIEEKIKPEPQEHIIVKYQDREQEAEEKKKQILEKDPDAKILEIYVKYV
jgi:hypothetical protein